MQPSPHPWASRSFSLAAGLSVAVLFAPSGGGEPVFANADKVVHYLLFALLAGTVRWRFGPARRLLWLLFGYAVLSEVIQAVLLPGRSGDVVDVFADIGGAALGWLVAERYLRRSPVQGPP